MKKVISILIASVLILGCTPGIFYPKTMDEVLSKTKIEEDGFSGTKWVKFPSLRPNQLSNYKEITGISAWQAPPGYFIARISVDENNEPKFFQIYYITDNAPSWSFYHSAKDNYGNSLEVIKIASNVVNDGAVHTIEEFAINFDKNYLVKYKNDNLILKIYGKKNDDIFYIPQYYLEAIYKYFYENK